MEFTKRAIRSAQSGINAEMAAACGLPVEVIQEVAATSCSARWGLRAMYFRQLTSICYA